MSAARENAGGQLYAAVVHFLAAARYNVKHGKWTVGTFGREDAGPLVVALIRFKSTVGSGEAEDAVERGATALYGELSVGPDALANRDEWDKDRLRLAARRILHAANDPMWGRRAARSEEAPDA